MTVKAIQGDFNYLLERENNRIILQSNRYENIAKFLMLIGSNRNFRKVSIKEDTTKIFTVIVNCDDQFNALEKLIKSYQNFLRKKHMTFR